nr:PREDICTED: cingulin [Latimeria chalumnae]|eukprot:XP_006013391.1 PREDICTED: cingulin [Latimeria chalumnae]
MEESVNGNMADKQSNSDYGVQIRFINDLKETNNPKKAKNLTVKSSSYGVAIRVQGIGGQPFVVLNSGEKGDSYGVKLNENPYSSVPQNTTAPGQETYNTLPMRSESSNGVARGSDVPENPYGDRFPTRQHSRSDSLYSTSDEELGSKSLGKFYDLKSYKASSNSVQSYRSDGSASSQSGYKSLSYRKPSSEPLKRSQSQGSLMKSDLEEAYPERGYDDHSLYRSPAAVEVLRSNSVLNLASTSEMEHNKGVSSHKPLDRQESSSSESSISFKPLRKSTSPAEVELKNVGSSTIDTNPLSSVDALINKFDGRVTQHRGRAGRRNRISFDERKRSQSHDGRLSYRDTMDDRELRSSDLHISLTDTSKTISGRQPRALNTYSTSSLGRPVKGQLQKVTAAGLNTASKEWQLKGKVDEPVIERAQMSTVQTEVRLKSTPDLLKDQQELPQPGSDDYTKQIIFNILKEGSTENELSMKRKASLIFEKMQPVKEKAFNRVDHGYLFETLLVFSFGPCFVGLLQLLYASTECLVKIDWLMGVALGLQVILSAYANDILLVAQDLGDLEKVQECQQLSSAVSSARVNWAMCSRLLKYRSLEAERNQPNANMHNLQIQLEESMEESSSLKELYTRNKQELQSSLQELMQVKMEKEQIEAKMRDLEEQLMAAEEEQDRFRHSLGEKDSILTELMEAKGEMQEMIAAKQKQDDLLHQRERELTALKGVLKDEVATHDKDMDRLRLQYQKDMDQLRKNFEDVTQNQQNIESERQKINLTVRNLQRKLEESNDESNHWRELFQKNKEELRSTKQELLQVRTEKEEYEEELRTIQERLSVMQVEVDHVKHSAVDNGEAEALRRDLYLAQEELGELSSERQQQSDFLRQKERELATLKGALKEEVASHDRQVEQLRHQYQKELEQLRKTHEDSSKNTVNLETKREVAEQAKRVLESELRQSHQENDDLRRRASSLELQIAELRGILEEMQSSEARLKDKISRLEAERKHMEESLGEVTDQEQELATAKRAMELRLEEAQRSLSRLSQEHQELREYCQDELKQKEQLKKTKNELEEQKRLLEKTRDKLTKELDQLSEESRRSMMAMQSQLEEYKEKFRREAVESQRQTRDKTMELEKAQAIIKRLQDEALRLKQDLQESQAEKETALLDKELLTQRLQHLDQEAQSKKQSQDDMSRKVKALEDRIRTLELELDEERNTAEMMTERTNRNRDQIDQLRAELLQERAAKQDLECDKIAMERQNRELKSRLSNFEGFQKPNAGFSQLELKVQELEEQLQGEEREKNLLLSSNRKLERKLKELSLHIDDEKQQVSDQKDQLSLRVKALKRQVDEAEEEIERLENAKKKAQRELEEQHEVNEQLQSKIKALEKDLWRKNTRPSVDPSLLQDDFSSDEDFSSAYDPFSITSALTENNLQTSSC